MDAIKVYKDKFEHFGLLMQVVLRHLDFKSKTALIYEYKAPFEFYSRNTDGSKELCLSASYIFSSCNSVISDDPKFNSVEDLMDEINTALEEDVLSVVVNILKSEFNCIMIANKDDM